MLELEKPKSVDESNSNPDPIVPQKECKKICSYVFVCLFVSFYHHRTNKKTEVAKLQGYN